MQHIIKVNIEDGKITSEKPINIKGKSSGILTIIDENIDPINSNKLKSNLKKIRKVNPFAAIDDPIQWQKELRKDRKIF